MKRKKFTKEERARIHEKTNGRCGYCGVTLDGNWNIDHMQPIALAGDHEFGNLIAACFPCNNLKHNQTVEMFRNTIDMQLPRLDTHSVNYRTCKRFNLIEPKPKQIVFYFELELKKAD